MTKKTDLHPLMNYDGCINTYSGVKFNLLDPKPEMVELTDIARGLAFKGHFGGQTPFFFSIAEHSLLVQRLIKKEIKEERFDLYLAGLLHDAAEAYIGDMIKPLKIHLPFYCEVETKIQQAIFDHFKLNIELLKKVKPFDIEAQKIEYSEFYCQEETGWIDYMGAQSAFDSFYRRTEYYLNKLQ